MITKIENCTYDGKQSFKNLKKLLTTSCSILLVYLILATFYLRICHYVLKTELFLDIQVAQQNIMIHKIA